MESIIDCHGPPASARWSPNATKAYPASTPGSNDANFDSRDGCASGATGCCEVRGQENEDAAIEPMAAPSRSKSAAPRARALRAFLPLAAACGFVCLTLGSFLSAAPACAEPPDSTDSYWGPIPANSDSICVPLLEPSKPLWEKTVLVPYRVVTYPIVLLSRGTGEAIQFFEGRRVIDGLTDLLGPRTGPFELRVIVQAGGLSGWGGGLVAEHKKFFGDQNVFRARASTTSERDHRLGAAASFGGPRGRFLEIGTGYRHRPNVRFFGLGPDARVEDLSYLDQIAGWAGATIRRPLGGHSHVDLGATYTSVAVGAPNAGQTPAAGDLFPASDLPGYGDHSDGMTYGTQWMRQTMDFNGRPLRGGFQRLRAGYFEGFDTSHTRFYAFRGEAQQFLTLWRPLRVLALHGMASWMERAGETPIPIERLNSNDDTDQLRGYDDFRWRDRGIMILTAEYRWPIWAHERALGPGLDGYFLTDVGQVFGDAAQISLANLTHSYGAGLRFEMGGGAGVRVEYARSDEGSIVRLRTDLGFQFIKRGFLYGNEPIPDR
jgi:hypothetical protein